MKARFAGVALAAIASLWIGCGDSNAQTPTGRGSASGGPGPSGKPPGSTSVTNPPPSSGKHPNIVFILADDQRLDAAEKCMPKVKELIGDKGVTFTQNFAGTPLCCPGRSTILTGLYAHNHGVITNGDIEEEGDVDDEKVPGAVAFRDYKNEEKVFAKWLREVGYTTGFYGKYLNGYTKILEKEHAYTPPYWDEWHAFTDAEFYDFTLVEKSGAEAGKVNCYLTNRDIPKEKKNTKLCKKLADKVIDDGKENYSTDVLADQSVAFIRGAVKAGKPFFLELSIKAPHEPAYSPARYQPDLDKIEFSKEATDRLGNCPFYEWKDRPESFMEKDVTDKPEWVTELQIPAERANKVRKKQLMSVLANEDALVKIEDVLKELHIEGDTIVIYTGDNGYSWGEHGYVAKNCAYDECAKVPMVVFDPRHPGGGKTLDVFTMNVDLAPTFADLAGAKVPGKVDGQSMAKLFGGDATGWSRDYVLTECWGTQKKAHPDIHAAVRSKQWKYVEHYEDVDRTKVKTRKDKRSEIELYDLSKDPFELDNLALLSKKDLEAKGTTEEKVKEQEKSLAERLHKIEKE